MTMFKAGVIGLGQIGLMYDFDKNRKGTNSHSLAYRLHPDIKLVAGQDVRKEQENYLKQIAPEALFYDDLSEMLIQEQFDIISICTPPDQHLTTIKQILSQASPSVIFCEKPVVCNLEEVQELKYLLHQNECLFIPNLSRRWNAGVQHIASVIQSGTYGAMQKIHVRYTRGIYNTGSHVFDLLNFFSNKIDEVRVLYKVPTSSDRENDPSFSFAFETEHGARGFAEAFNDIMYYMFEIDFYLESGKIEFRMSGDQINILAKHNHPLFAGFDSLHPVYEKIGLLEPSNIAAAVDHIVQVLNGKESLLCSLDDGIYPLYVSDALMRSFQNQGSREQVGDDRS
jgi:predicted dehydrogenase